MKAANAAPSLTKRRTRTSLRNLLVLSSIAAAVETGATARVPEHPLLTRDLFDAAFPERLPFYEYEALARALAAFPMIFSVGSQADQRREVAAFLAQVSHETGGLRLVREENEAAWGSYCDPTWVPCIEGRLYFGRGPIQLSWNYNYAAAGAALGRDLLSNPDLVEYDATLAFETAVWFWTTQVGAGRMTAHQAITEGYGFAETTRSINGTLECDQPPDSLRHEQMRHRAGLFVRFSAMLEVPVEGSLLC